MTTRRSSRPGDRQVDATILRFDISETTLRRGAEEIWNYLK
jgi:hypothetical protein